jgi:antitoxin (DNA-binding transcriptional repressor) of toxin-antitoxin stability system
MDSGRAFRFLKAIDVRDATGSLGEYVSSLSGETIVVMDGDTPVAALVPVRGADLESLSIGTDPDFLDLLEQSRRRQREEGGISSDEMRRRLGIRG